jgi:hypothetical protein
MINIREAHPERIKAPGNPCDFARAQVQEKQLSFTCVLDGDGRDAELAYQAWPLRLVILDPGGRVAYDAGIGVFHQWDLPAIGNWLEGHVGPSRWPPGP